MNIITLTKADLFNVGTNTAWSYSVSIPSFFITQVVDRLAHKIFEVEEGTKTSYCIKAASVITCTAVVMHFASPIVLVSLSIRKLAELIILGFVINKSIKYLTDINYSRSDEASSDNPHNAANKLLFKIFEGFICQTLLVSIVGSSLAVRLNAYSASTVGVLTDKTLNMESRLSWSSWFGWK